MSERARDRPESMERQDQPDRVATSSEARQTNCGALTQVKWTGLYIERDTRAGPAPSHRPPYGRVSLLEFLLFFFPSFYFFRNFFRIPTYLNYLPTSTQHDPFYSTLVLFFCLSASSLTRLDLSSLRLVMRVYIAGSANVSVNTGM